MKPTIYESFKSDYPQLFQDVCKVTVDDSCECLIVHFKNGSIYAYALPERSLYSISQTRDVTGEEYTKAFGFKLERILRIRGLKQNALARMTGLTQGTISNYACGKTIPSIWQLNQIARALDIPTESLLFKF